MFLSSAGFAKCIEGDCLNGFGIWAWGGKKYESKYVGNFKNGKFHGQGTYIKPNGYTTGEFRDDRMHDVVTVSMGSVIKSQDYYDTMRCYTLYRGPDYKGVETSVKIKTEKDCIESVQRKYSKKTNSINTQSKAAKK